jgi:RNA polymerase sigma-70 factor, ECF subfamily
VEKMVELLGKNNKMPIVSTCILTDKEFQALLKEYEIELRYLAFKYVRDWIIVEDIMQEVFIKIFLKLDSFEQRSSIR